MEIIEWVLKILVWTLLIYYVYKNIKLKKKYYHDINKNIKENETRNSKIKNFLERYNLWCLSSFTLDDSIKQLMECIKTERDFQKELQNELTEKNKEIRKLQNTITEKDKYIKRQMWHINTLYTRIAYREKIIEKNWYKMKKKSSKKYW